LTVPPHFFSPPTLLGDLPPSPSPAPATLPPPLTRPIPRRPHYPWEDPEVVETSVSYEVELEIPAEVRTSTPGPSRPKLGVSIPPKQPPFQVSREPTEQQTPPLLTVDTTGAVTIKPEEVPEGMDAILQQIADTLNVLAGLQTAAAAAGAPQGPPVMPAAAQAVLPPRPKPPMPMDYNGNREQAMMFLRQVRTYTANIPN
jgi:hypothetical protein